MFLSGFYRLDSYKTHRFYTVSDIINIFFGLRSPDRNTTEYEDINSNIDIEEDVLCLALNYYESPNKLSEDLIIESVMYRALGNTKKHLLNWLYFRGIESELDIKYKNIKQLFTSGRENFVYYDLNTGHSVSNTDQDYSDSNPVNDLY